jgi:hypothetical protein
VDGVAGEAGPEECRARGRRRDWRGGDMERFWQRGQAVVGAQCGGGELKVACAGEPVAEARHSGGDLEMADVG